ncbi:tetratricopeptide repeat protein [Parabacteroides sp. PF5-9]|uniref:tetratricopeptide repeat protein n=1 Tax=Parabacteroides sp. PF5-9 TaxID=1742404 RepID=UPI0024736222|nr:tetratricopeptide repeat protein [Parabacteroides sp. PF5-9]MDH6356796.1 tetratricopeptide (TPR) repeat protein [Parabacteroides sp. PF5-9]
MKRVICKLFYTISILFIGSGLYAQSLDQAKKMYNEGQYEEAKPAFERLVKQAPNNSSYNQWYGVCCYETGDLETAEKHLLVAAKRKVQESFRYLAELYYKTYRFEESAEMFEEYIDILAGKNQPVETFETRLDQANNAARMLDKVEDVEIIDSVVVDKRKFLAVYPLSEESGRLMSYSDFFKNEKVILSSVYMNQRGDKIYYARETNDNQLCLFNQSKLLEEWGDEKQLPMNINSEGNENFPFVLSDGVTIYYASTGNGSLGGYDLFVTRYTSNSDTYLTPEQLGMPFNSPANDYMLVIDEGKNLGWFVSDRFQPEGKVCVYLFIPNTNKARIESEDLDLKRSRALITAISDSWKEEGNYNELIELAYAEVSSGINEVKKDFEFIVNDNTIYYTLEEIKSPEARNQYEKVVALRKQITEQQEKLEGLRQSYTTGNAARKDQLRATILQAESLLEGLLVQPRELEKKARNTEINFLKLNR